MLKDCLTTYIYYGFNLKYKLHSAKDDVYGVFHVIRLWPTNVGELHSYISEAGRDFPRMESTWMLCPSVVAVRLDVAIQSERRK